MAAVNKMVEDEHQAPHTEVTLLQCAVLDFHLQLAIPATDQQLITYAGCA